MRVVLVTPEWPPTGGIGRYTSILAPALREAGADVTVVGFNLLPRLGGPRVEHSWGSLISLDYSLPALWRVARMIDPSAVLHAAIAVRRWIAENTDDATVIEYPNWPGHGALLPKRRRTVVRLSSTTAAIVSGRWRWHNHAQLLLERASVRNAACVIAHTDTVAEAGVALYNRRSDAVIPLGLDDQPLERQPSAEWTDVAVIGRAEMRKGTDVLLAALLRVPRLSNLRLHLVGADLDAFAGHVGLKSLVAAVRAQYGARLVEHGRIGDAAMVELLSRVSWLLMPSRFESFGLAALEGMRAGVPVVMSRTGGWECFGQEALPLGAFEAGDVDALVTALERICEVDHAQRETWGQAARARFQQHFSARKMAERTLDVYQTL